jgi:hypothetical protein
MVKRLVLKKNFSYGGRWEVRSINGRAPQDVLRIMRMASYLVSKAAACHYRGGASEIIVDVSRKDFEGADRITRVRDGYDFVYYNYRDVEGHMCHDDFAAVFSGTPPTTIYFKFVKKVM